MVRSRQSVFSLAFDGTSGWQACKSFFDYCTPTRLAWRTLSALRLQIQSRNPKIIQIAFKAVQMVSCPPNPQNSAPGYLSIEAPNIATRIFFWTPAHVPSPQPQLMLLALPLALEIFPIRNLTDNDRHCHWLWYYSTTFLSPSKIP